MPHIELAGGTHVGRVRRNNEDSYALMPELHAAVVADGMGGAACGEVASAMTVEEVEHILRDSGVAEGAEEDMLITAVKAANSRVWAAAQSSQDCTGMGSTLVLAYWRGNRLWVANVGDSRAYSWREGKLKQLSFDQNVANELRASLGLTDAQINQYPYRNALTMAIGTAEKVTARICVEQLENGDLLLLCSDGLSGPVSDTRISEVLGRDDDLQRMVQDLIDEANRAGGPDNVTAVVLRYKG